MFLMAEMCTRTSVNTRLCMRGSKVYEEKRKVCRFHRPCSLWNIVLSCNWDLMCYMRFDVLYEIWCVIWDLMCYMRFDVLYQIWCVISDLMCSRVRLWNCVGVGVCAAVYLQCDNRRSMYAHYLRICNMKISLAHVSVSVCTHTRQRPISAPQKSNVAPSPSSPSSGSPVPHPKMTRSNVERQAWQTLSRSQSSASTCAPKLRSGSTKWRRYTFEILNPPPYHAVCRSLLELLCARI